MNIQNIVKILTDAGIEPNEANIEVKMLLEHFTGFGVKNFLLGSKLDDEKLEIVREKAELRAKTRQPIQHIIGLADFMGEKFIVNKNVLIPRDETEILVRKAIEITNKNHFEVALDIGTGSGCIACMLAKYTDCQVIGTDVSSEALNVALDNASRLNLFNKAIFRKSDVFSNVRPNEIFDIIISNPPYIPLSEKIIFRKRLNLTLKRHFSPLMKKDWNSIRRFLPVLLIFCERVGIFYLNWVRGNLKMLLRFLKCKAFMI